MIYVDNFSTDPYFNFGLEYYLISEKKLDDDLVFLFWRTAPTLMVGKYQNTLEEINEKYVKEKNINVVRRMSGGGTIYTDLGGWQFSFLARGRSGKISFSEFITPVVQALRDMGVDAGFTGRNDLVIDGKKFSGNAQYLHNEYTVHHGSLLFDTNLEEMVKSTTVDEYKIISKGIKSVRDRVTNIVDHMEQPISPEAFKEKMVSCLMGGQGKTYALTQEDMVRIREIAAAKFQNWQAIYGASPRFNITRVGRFEGGKMEFKLDVHKGKIQEAHIYGDFFGTADIAVLCDALVGCEYNRESIEKALSKLEIERLFYKIRLDDILDSIV